MKKVILLVFLHCAISTADAQTRVILDSPVKVTAQAYTENKSETRATAASTASTTFNLTISGATHQFQLTVAQPGSYTDALAALKARSGWKDGYLFVRDDCLGAVEDKRAARCVVDQLFTFVESANGKRLVHLGEVSAGDDCAAEAKFGCALYQGVFTDIFDAFENSTMIRRGDAPTPLLEMRAVNGQLVVDLDETWGRNQERFTAGERCLAAKQTERSTTCVDGITPRRAFLFNATLATYTKREAQLTRVRAFARSALCDPEFDINVESECSESLRKSALLLAGIRPGEKPRARSNVRSAAITPGK